MVHTLKAYINHWLHEVNSHSLHAPLIYQLYTGYIQNDYNKSNFESFEATRKKLQAETFEVETSALGAASTVHSGQTKVKAGVIAKRGITPARISRLLARLADFSNAQTMIELGTSFGINTLYMASKKNSRIFTFEAAPDIAQVALTNFEHHGFTNIELLQGNIDQTLPQFLDTRLQIDLAFIDANHRLTPTLNYFNEILKRMHGDSIMVIDDIYWSEGMTQAWQAIKAHPQVTLSIDLFKIGIVLFKPDLTKTHYRLMF